MFGSEGATAIDPIDPVGCPSNIGFQVCPKSVVFQTPPFVAAIKNTFGCAGIPSTATVRPALKGPTSLYFISAKRSAGTFARFGAAARCARTAEAATKDNTTTALRREQK